MLIIKYFSMDLTGIYEIYGYDANCRNPNNIQFDIG